VTVAAAVSAEPRRSRTPRLLAGLAPRRALTLDEHTACYGRPVVAGDLLGELEAAGLRGRGGAGFPTAAKARAVAARRGRPVVVVNAAEGEPLSGKDKLLIGRLPHLVLDGAVALASAVGARQVIVAHAAGARREGEALRAAIDERTGRRLHDRVAVAPVAVPDGYVTGQETALVRFLNGGPALPTFTPPRPFESGVGGRPTLVQNAETAAHVALVARNGAEWFRRAGTQLEPGTALFSVSGAIARPGVYEAPVGVPLTELVNAAGGLVRAPRAVLVGGYAGAWIDAGTASRLTLDEEGLRAHGVTLGVGAVAVLPEGACGVCETARVVRYLAREGAGQCGPCVHGLAALAGGLDRRPDRAVLGRHAQEVRGRGACRHPDGAARLVASALSVFARELDAHEPRSCSAGGGSILPTPGGHGR
jgi:NADH:ubiquinone oxidoreductase subunit F (NADH-binding)